MVVVAVEGGFLAMGKMMNSKKTILPSMTRHLTRKLTEKGSRWFFLQICVTLVAFLRDFLSWSHFCDFVIL